MGSPVNIIKIGLLKEKTIELNIVIKAIEHVLNYNPLNIEEKILLKYIEFQNMADIASMMNDEGYRIKSDIKGSERKYIQQDISEVINNTSNNANELINRFAKLLYKFNKGKANWNSVVKYCDQIIEKRK